MQAARTRVRKHSGLQNQVFALYRDCIRAAKQKSSTTAQIAAIEFVRSKFRKNAAIRRSDFQRIEFLIRQGKKQLAMFGAPDVDGFGVAVIDTSTRR
jgi:hypothetical protein